ncbi:MAG: NUDIX domain-containing protein [Lapillicoccus sp.]
MTDPQGDHHVVAAVLVRRHRVLLCHRRPDREWFPDVWDLPGGHVGAGETFQAAVRRECREELGIDVVAEARVRQIREGRLQLSVHLVTAWRGEPVNAAPDEHDALGWFTAGELDGVSVADDRYQPLLDDAIRRAGEAT